MLRRCNTISILPVRLYYNMIKLSQALVFEDDRYLPIKEDELFTGPSLKSEFNWYAPLKKIDVKGRRIVAGYASVEVIDKQGEIIPVEALKKAWLKFKANPDYAHCMVMHSNIPVGKVIFEKVVDSEGREHQSGVDDIGLYIVSELRDDIKKANETWEAIKEGRITGYSIGGEALLKTRVCEGDRCYIRIDDLELHEISYVDRPANEPSRFTILKRDEICKLTTLLSAVPNMIISKGIVKIVGSTVELGEGHDFDVMIKAPKGSYLYRAIQTRIYNELRRRNRLYLWNKIQWLEPEYEGPYTDYKDWYDLVLLRSPDPIRRMEVREELGDGGFDLAPLDQEPNKRVEEKRVSEEKETKVEGEEVEKAPITLETIAASLAKLTDLLERFVEVKAKTEEEEEEEEEKAETEEAEKAKEKEPAKYPYPEKERRRGKPRTEEERRRRHQRLYGTSKLPPRGSGLASQKDEEKIEAGESEEEKAKEPEKEPQKYPYPEKKLEEMIQEAIRNALGGEAVKRSKVVEKPVEEPVSLFEMAKMSWDEVHRIAKSLGAD